MSLNKDVVNHLTKTVAKAAKAEERQKWETFEITSGKCVGYFFEFPPPAFGRNEDGDENSLDNVISRLENGETVEITHNNYGTFTIDLVVQDKVSIKDHGAYGTFNAVFTVVLLPKELAYAVFRASYDQRYANLGGMPEPEE